jgi:hypothetical protein
MPASSVVSYIPPILTGATKSATRISSAPQLRQLSQAAAQKGDSASSTAYMKLAHDMDMLEKTVNSIQQTLSTVSPTIGSIDSLKNSVVALSSSNGAVTLDPVNTEISITTTASEAEIVLNTTPSLILYDQEGNPIVQLTIQTESALSCTATSNASPDVVTVPGHTYVDGDTVHGTGFTGDTAPNGFWVVENVSGSTFTLASFTGTPVNGNGAYAGGGTFARYYAGLLAQTVALGSSFTNFSLRLFADGHMEIANASFSGGNFTDSTLNNVNLTSTTGTTGNVLTLAINNGQLTASGTGTEAGQGTITIDGIMKSGLVKLAHTASGDADGVMRFDGTHLYFTIGSTTHTLI